MATGGKGGKKTVRWVLMCVLAGAAVCGVLFFFHAFGFPYAAEGTEPLLTGWHYYLGETTEGVDWPVYEGYIPVEPGQEITLVRTMTETLEPAALLLRLDFLQAEVRLGDRVLFSNAFDPPGKDKGDSYRVVPLPDGYTGQRLAVTVSSPYALYSFSPDTLWIGEAGALSARVMGWAAEDVALMVVTVASGLGLMLFNLVTRGGWSGMLFGLASVLYGLWLPGQGGAYLGAFSPMMAARLRYATFYLYPVPMLWFLWRKCGRIRTQALALSILYTAVAVPATAAMCLGLVAPPDIVWLVSPAVIGATLCMFLLVLVEWVQKNPFFRMTGPAFLVLAVAAVLSLIDLRGFFTPQYIIRVTGLLLLAGLVWVDILRTYLDKRRQQTEEMQLLRLKGEMALEQFEASVSHNRETHLLRHEVRHHLAALSVLRRQGDLQGMADYLDTLVSQTDSQERDTVQYCAHLLTNAILVRMAADCAREGIAFTCEAEVPASLAVEDGAVASLLLNMLENAREAALQAPEGKRWIAMRLVVRDGLLVIRCANARSGRIERKGERFLTTKRNVRRHGLGIAVMRQVAENYGGEMQFDYDEESFTAKAILRLTA